MEHIETNVNVRFTLIGISLKCQSYGSQLYTSFLSASLVHFVTSKIEGRCGTCGIENEYVSSHFNQMPWVVAIRETVKNPAYPSGYTIDHKHFTGTLVSKEYVVTAARFFKDTPHPEDYEDNFKVIPGASTRAFVDPNAAFSDPDSGVLSVYHISIHPSYNRSGTADVDFNFNVALMQLKTRISDLIPFEAGYVYRPICLPVPGQILENTLVGTTRETTHLGTEDQIRIISKNVYKSKFEKAFKKRVEFPPIVKR